jgi:hypothetical protein
MLPPVPLVAKPDFRTTAPLLPLLDDPDFRVKPPLTPADPESAVRTLNEPLLDDEL